MATYVFITLVCVLTGAGMILYRRAVRKSLADAARPDNLRRERQYAGVAIRPGTDACEAAKNLRGRKLLVGEAPSLPLSGCKNARCRCVFRKFDDRRDGEARRWSDIGINATLYAGEERRAHSADRRDD